MKGKTGRRRRPGVSRASKALLQGPVGVQGPPGQECWGFQDSQLSRPFKDPGASRGLGASRNLLGRLKKP